MRLKFWLDTASEKRVFLIDAGNDFLQLSLYPTSANPDGGYNQG